MNTLSYKTVSANKETVQKEWYIVDAQDEVLGRLASKVAMVLRGKHKPSYTPHVDCGDNVIVINAEKVKLTGRKLQQKQYDKYTYYTDGRKVDSIAEVMAKKPEQVIQLAVRRMLPKNKLGRQMLKRLKIYCGPEHPHQAQQPQGLELDV